MTILDPQSPMVLKAGFLLAIKIEHNKISIILRIDYVGAVVYHLLPTVHEKLSLAVEDACSLIQ